MPASQGEVRHRMIEGRLVQRRDAECPPLVIRVAALAGRRLLPTVRASTSEIGTASVF
jgi:hypothetical protein